MKVCVCVCVCVRRPGGLPHNPGPAGSTPPSRGICVDNFAGASKQKLLLGVGLQRKILSVGGSPQLWAHRVHPTKWGVYALRIGQWPANKNCSLGWV